MLNSALLVVDVQESFRHRDYYSDEGMDTFIANVQALVDQHDRLSLPVVQIFHTEPTGIFSVDSGLVRSFEPLRCQPAKTIFKRKHGAFAGTDLDIWLKERRISHLVICGIRTEQCCETTARYASDAGYSVDFVLDATQTYAKEDPDGRLWSADEIKARTALVLHERFARILSTEDLLMGLQAENAAWAQRIA
jgi:nicotinamidase-related amidase